MITTIKLAQETKERLTSLDLSEKGKTYDMLVNDLITFYQKYTKGYTKDYKKWTKDYKRWQAQGKDHQIEWKTYQRKVSEYEKERKVYDREKKTLKKLLSWAKSKGFRE